MAITLGLNTALSGLLTAQKSLDVISQNVVNVNTAGYTRKILMPESRVLNGVGAGVQVTTLQRDVDEGLLADLRGQDSTLTQLSTLHDTYSQISDLFGKVGDETSVSHRVQGLLDQLVALSATPDKNDVQLAVVQSATTLSDQLNDLSTKLQGLRSSADQDIALTCDQINTKLAAIYDLNNKIVRNLAIGTDATDLMDKRDTALSDLSKLIDVKYYQASDGSVTVGTSSGRVLVSNGLMFQLDHSAVSSAEAWMSKSAGQLGGILVGSGTDGVVDITSAITNGQLKGEIDLRDTVIPNLQAQLDKLSSQMQSLVNLVHNRGATMPKPASSYTGTRLFANQNDLTQSISLSGTQDTAMVLYDGQGNQLSTTTLRNVMDGSAFSPAKSVLSQPWTINNVAQRMQDWLQGQNYLNATQATVGLDSSGRFTINTGNTSYGLAFRDQENTSEGSDAADVSVIFHSDDSGTTTTTNVNSLASTTPLGTNAQTVAAVTTKLDGSNLVATGDVLQLVVNGTTYTYTVAANDTGATLQTFVNGITGLTGTFVSDAAGVSHLRIDSTLGQQVSMGSGTSTSFAGLALSIAPATPDETVSGFSNFLGLNDFFVQDKPRAMFESNVVANDTRTTVSRTLTLYDRTGQTGNTISIPAGSTIEDIAAKINLNTQTFDSGALPQNSFTLANSASLTLYDASNRQVGQLNLAAGNITLASLASSLGAPPSSLVAKVVQDGSNYRLRVWSTSGGPLSIQYAGTGAAALQDTLRMTNVHQFNASVNPEGSGERLLIRQSNNEQAYVSAGVDSANTSILTDLGIGSAATESAIHLQVRRDIQTDPALISHAATQWNADLRRYTLSTGDNAIATQMVTAFNSKYTMSTAGRLSTASYALTDYATMTVAMTSQDAANNQDLLDYQTNLSQSLTSQYQNKSSVNLDEEVANMVNFQQAYSASAKVISTLSDMLEILVNIVK